jgi:hypothetical protein
MFWQIYPRQANCQEKLGFPTGMDYSKMQKKALDM